MARYPAILFVFTALALAGDAAAGEIYKWTDEQGNVHYVDRPTGDPTEQRLDVISNRTNSAAVQASISARHERQNARAEARAEAAEKQKLAAEQQALEEERQQQCEKLRARLETFLYSRRLYREDDAGERVYLSDDEAMQARANLQEKIQETCD